MIEGTSTRTNYYSDAFKTQKRALHYETKRRNGKCGVHSPLDRPWFCGEMTGCCTICRNYYKKNAECKR